jgi:hypothetical protein
MDLETWYRCALHELEAAEQEFEAHVALERARQLPLIRQQSTTKAIRREPALTIQSEIERVERTRALQALVEERLEQRKLPSRPQAALSRVPCHGLTLFGDFADADSAERFVPHRRFPRYWRSSSRPHFTHCPTRRDDEDVFTVEDLSKFLGGLSSCLEPEPTSATQEFTSCTAEPRPEPEPQLQSQLSSQPQPQRATPKRDDGEVAFNNILEFFHSIASQARDAVAGYQSAHEVRVSFLNVQFKCLTSAAQADAPLHPKDTPADENGKGKSKVEPVSELALLQALFGERMNGGLDREMRDIEQAIELSLQDRDATNVKRASASKSFQSSPGASSSKVRP